MFSLFFALCSPRASAQEAPVPEASAPKGCVAAIEELFAHSVSQETLQRFLQLQAQLTLNRLAWAYLAHAAPDSDGVVRERVEHAILRLLNEKFKAEGQDEAFIQARDAFEAAPLSRRALKNIAPYLEAALKAQNKARDPALSDFYLNTSDLKMIDLLAEKESGDPRFFKNRKSDQSVLNLMTLVQSSFRSGTGAALTEEGTKKTVRKLEETISALEKKTRAMLASVPAPAACKNVALGCVDCEREPTPEQRSIAGLLEVSDQLMLAAISGSKQGLPSDDLLYRNLRYGDAWVQVKRARSPAPAPTPSKQTARAQPAETAGERPLSIDRSLVSDRWLKDPLSVALKHMNQDAPYYKVLLRKEPKEALLDMEKEHPGYVHAFANALLREDRTFIFDNRLYDASSGEAIAIQKALEGTAYMNSKFKPGMTKLPDPTEGLSPDRIDLLLHAANARKNGKNYFTMDGKLYNRKTVEANLGSKPLDPRFEIAKTSGRKAEDYAGLADEYALARALALKNENDRFIYQNKNYDARTGRSLASPFLPEIAGVSFEERKEGQDAYNKLSMSERLVLFHKENPKVNACPAYLIVDKRAARLRWYSNSGQEIRSEKILVGHERSDQKMTFSFNPKTYTRKGDGKTAAGAFSTQPKQSYAHSQMIGEPGAREWIALDTNPPNGISRLALYRVSDGTKDAQLLKSNRPDQRRSTAGNIGLEDSVFDRVSKELSNECPVYVLPEEEGNLFYVKNNRVNFTSDQKLGEKSSAYAFSPKSRDYFPIDIRIVANDAKTPLAFAFVKTLSERKKELMRNFDLDNDEYNELVKISFGILGQESSYGESERYKLKLLMKIQSVLANASGLRVFDPYAILDGVKSLQGRPSPPSEGPTQIKTIPDLVKKHYPELDKGDLYDGGQAAIVTLGYLAQELKRLKAKIDSDRNPLKLSRYNVMDFIGYMFNKPSEIAKGTATPNLNRYIRNINQYGEKIRIVQSNVPQGTIDPETPKYSKEFLGQLRPGLKPWDPTRSYAPEL